VLGDLVIVVISDGAAGAFFLSTVSDLAMAMAMAASSSLSQTTSKIRKGRSDFRSIVSQYQLYFRSVCWVSSCLGFVVY